MIVERHRAHGLPALIIADQDGDLIVGFEGMPWHTHGDILAELSGLPRETAVANYVRDIVSGRLTIAVLRQDGDIVDVWISDDPTKDRAYAAEGEDLEFPAWG